MAFDFKPQQQLALDYPGNVAVSAGAGSGKTRVLVEKYFRLLVDQHPEWQIDSVVAITFTIKAAAELRARIVKRVREELLESGLPAARRTRLLELRREIAGAPIGTIHNFCSRMLREFAFEARLNPDFSIVEGAQESSLRREAALAAIAEAAAKPATRAYADLVTLHSVYKRPQLIAMLGSMLSKRTEFSPACRRYVELDEEQIWQELQELCEASSRETKIQLYHDLQNCLAALRKSVGPRGEELLQPIASALEDLAQTELSAPTLLKLAAELQLAVFTKDGSLRKAIEKAWAISGQNECIQRLQDACNACAKAGAMELTEEDRQSVVVTAMLARLYQRCEELYGESRSAAHSAEEVDLLDFTDLELLAERLITRNDSIRTLLRTRLRYLIVDEFQDTSEIQWRILGPLVCDDDNTMLPSRFFMVGDPKQGVYGFRQASSRLFSHVRQLVMQSNPADHCRGDISITYNFRTLSNPLRAVNDLFSGLMDSSVQHDVGFEALEPQRLEPDGTTTLYIAQAEAVAGEGIQPTEADLLAQHIVDLRGKTCAASAGTVAILLRKRKHFESYEQALRRRNIPFVTHRGRGLYEQPEVLGILALLQLLADPANDLLAAQVCRGPLFNFPDDLLLKLALSQGSTLWTKCCRILDTKIVHVNHHHLELSDGEISRLQHLIFVLKHLQSTVGFQQVDRLIDDVINLTGALSIFGGGSRAQQAAANISRFRQLSRTTGTTDLDDFLAYIESETLDARGQGEAATHDGAAGAVQIMTIHAAKGLEFDTVFLPELAEPISLRREDVLTDGINWMTVQRTLSPETRKLYLSQYLTREKEKRAIAEEKRVLYVAMTRCRDHLVLSATQREATDRESFYQWIYPQLNHLPNVHKVQPGAIHPEAGQQHLKLMNVQRSQLPYREKAASMFRLFGQPPSDENDQRLEPSNPFSPGAVPAAFNNVCLDHLLTADQLEVANWYPAFRQVFPVVWPARSQQQPCDVINRELSSFQLSSADFRHAQESLADALHYLEQLPELQSAIPGRKLGITHSDSGLVIQSYADLENWQDLGCRAYFVASAGCIRFTNELAALHRQVLEQAGYTHDVWVIDVSSKRQFCVPSDSAGGKVDFEALYARFMRHLNASNTADLQNLLN